MVISNEIIFDELETYVRHRGGKLISLDIIDSEHQKSIWYGEKAAVIEYNGYIFDISAIGNITAILSDKGKTSMITSPNGSDFYKQMKSHIRSDIGLLSLCNNQQTLTVLAENRWECVLHLPDVESNHTMTIALKRCETLEDAVRYASNGLSEIVEFAETEISKRKEKN